MSVALTEPQIRAGTKDVTRRNGWRNLKVGQQIQLIRKGMGLKKGEHPVKVRMIEVVAVTFERLDTISAAEVRREGFPEMSATEFVAFFCRTHRGVTPATVVTRIEFVYLDGPS